MKNINPRTLSVIGGCMNVFSLVCLTIGIIGSQPGLWRILLCVCAGLNVLLLAYMITVFLIIRSANAVNSQPLDSSEKSANNKEKGDAK